MQPPAKPVRPGGRLADTIDELESLIGTREQQAPPVLREELDDGADHGWGGRIPVLDELVDAGDLEPEPLRAPDPPHYSEQQIAELVDSLEDRIAGELDKLVDELKLSVTTNLVDELRNRLGIPRTGTGAADAGHAGDHTDPE